MRLYLSTIAAICLLTAAALIGAQLIPAAPVARVATIATVTRSTARPVSSTTSTTVDWRPGARYATALAAAQAHARQVAAAIRYASALAKQLELARRLVSHHTSIVPARPSWQPDWSLDRYCQVAPFIRTIWARDADWAISIAHRESRCEPGAYNPSGAKGIFQLLGHDDLIAAATTATHDCGTFDRARRIDTAHWSDPWCNISAAWVLYEGSGRAPWAL